MATEGIAVIIIAAFLLDRLIGDPGGRLHPIRIIGFGVAIGIKAYEKAGVKGAFLQFTAGAILTLTIVCAAYAVTWAVVSGFYHINYWVGLAVEAVVCCFMIAAKSLHDESMKVYHSAVAGDVEGARMDVSLIVGRDTENLDLPEIVKAAVETISENLSDGVVAPLMFIFIGGAPLGMAYKAVNTIDSMMGYRNEQFEYFGKFAARLDDAANLIPSRVSALLLIIGSVYVKGADAGRAARVFFRDRYNHKSPNAAQTESACAGALGLQLGGGNFYGGIHVNKPTIGDAINTPTPEYIIAANRLMYAAAINAAALLALAGATIFIAGGKVIV